MGELEAWHELFVMSGGAAAALVGLLFVAVSLNHEQIVATRHVAALAATAVVLLVEVLFVSVVALVPGQSEVVLGAELLAIGAALAAALAAALRHVRDLEQTGWRASRIALAVACTIPQLLAGATLAVGLVGGMYWLVPGLLAAFATATYNAWVLLIEIRR